MTCPACIERIRQQVAQDRPELTRVVRERLAQLEDLRWPVLSCHDAEASSDPHRAIV